MRILGPKAHSLARRQDSDDDDDYFPAAPAAPAASAVPLRIMPLGASVTFGVGSTTGNSYRKRLRGLLVAANQTVNYVGDRQNGDFADRDVEAVPGFVLHGRTPRGYNGCDNFDRAI